MYLSVLSEHMLCAPCVCAWCPWGHHISCNYSYRQLWATMRVPSANILHYRAISPASENWCVNTPIFEREKNYVWCSEVQGPQAGRVLCLESRSSQRDRVGSLFVLSFESNSFLQCLLNTLILQVKKDKPESQRERHKGVSPECLFFNRAPAEDPGWVEHTYFFSIL